MKEIDSVDYKKIGSRIREIPVKRKMSQAELAEKTQLSLPHISDIELGKTKMKLSTFVSLTEVLQVSADSVLRSNIPEVNGIYQNEFSELLSDCTPSEIDSILKIVKELKQTFHQKND